MTTSQPAKPRSVLLYCPGCKATGYVTWEGEGPGRKFVAGSNGFHHESGRTIPNRIVMVCDTCDHVQPD